MASGGVDGNPLILCNCEYFIMIYSGKYVCFDLQCALILRARHNLSALINEHRFDAIIRFCQFQNLV